MHIIFVISCVNVSLLSFALSEVVQGNYIFELDIRNNIFFKGFLQITAGTLLRVPPHFNSLHEGS